MSWQLKDQKTRYLLDELSTFCIRDQCFDGLQHPKSGYPMQKGTRIQTNDTSFANQFAQRCVGHDYDHVPIEGGNITYGTAFYPKKVLSTRSSNMENQDETVPKNFLNKIEEARMGEEINFTCGDCHSLNPLPTCYSCHPEEAMPVISDLLRDIPDDDEGGAERSSEQRLMRVHRNLGHPPNRLLVQLLKEAKAPESVIEIATRLECPICARYV